MDRRKFLKAGPAGLAGVSFLAGCTLNGQGTAEAQSTAIKSSEKPKNIIFLVSDGMSWSVPTIAEYHSYLFRGAKTQFVELLNDPEATTGFYDTQSLSSMVTDSSAGGSAWGCGSRIANGALNMLPDGTELTSIAELAQKSGRKVGLVTTTSMAHATPASFCVSHPSRGDMDGIAKKMIQHTDFLMGGGRRNFDDALQAEYRSQGFEVINSKKELSKLSRDKKSLGLFADGHLPYTVDHDHVDELKAIVPTLAEMTETAIEHLNGKGEGFLLQVEGGRVDHAAHGNDAGAIFKDQIAFDDAIRVACEFAHKNGDTLVVVTTDHANANPALNGMGGGYNNSTKCFQQLAKSKISFERLGGIIRDTSPTINADFARDLILEHYELELTPDHATIFANALKNQFPDELNQQQDGKNGIMAQILGNYTGIQFTGSTHTNDIVPVIAMGPGHELFSGFHPNTHAFAAMTGLWDIEHVNPTANTDYIPSLGFVPKPAALFQ